MIGDPNTTIITGYSLTTYKFGLQIKLGVQDKEEGPLVKDLQNIIVQKLIKLRQEERAIKRKLELEKNRVMDQTPSITNHKCTQKHAYLFNHYVPALRQIGLSLEKLQSKLGCFSEGLTLRLKKSGLKLQSIRITSHFPMLIARIKKDEKTSELPLLRFLTGKSGFQLIDSTQPRFVYKKCIDDLNANLNFKIGLNEYIKDDAGFFTRRYAYGEKPKVVIDLLMSGKIASVQGRFLRSNASELVGPFDIYLKGQTKKVYIRKEDYQKKKKSWNNLYKPDSQNNAGKWSRKKASYRTMRTMPYSYVKPKTITPDPVKPETKNGYIEVSDDTGKAIKYQGINIYQYTTGPSRFEFSSESSEMKQGELLFINQELGSGPHQRGICLSSTRKLIHGNQGERFRSDETVLIQVDLSQVRRGERRLCNLYSQEAQAETISLPRNYRDEEGAKMVLAEEQRDNAIRLNKEHTDTSTAKNREIFLLELRKEYITRISSDPSRQVWQLPDVYIKNL